MADPLRGLTDPTRILFELQKATEIAQNFSGCLEPSKIAVIVTNGLVDKFNCAFARLWLLEPEEKILRLVASSGMYTNINGSFARVPMGSYKVGKIAQNRVAFLSNNLAQESWVKDRDWAITNNIHGFAGYPLLVKDKVIGVLGVFSHEGMAPEFLEVLQTLCSIATIALDTALNYQKEKQNWKPSADSCAFNHLCLSDQLVNVIQSSRLTLVGTEKPLSLPVVNLFLLAAENLYRLGAVSYRLIYTSDSVSLEVILSTRDVIKDEEGNLLESNLAEIVFAASCLAGVVKTQDNFNHQATQVVIQIPYKQQKSALKLRIACVSSVLQLAFTQLSFVAGLTVCQESNPEIVLVTDDVSLISSAKNILWIDHGNKALPKGIKAKIDLSINSQQLYEAVQAVVLGNSWGNNLDTKTVPSLSQRELEILGLMIKGFRDRDIAKQLIISQSTVKFHINNSLKKLKAKTRFQVLHQAIINGWLNH